MPIYRNDNGIRKKTKLVYCNGMVIPQVYYGSTLVHQTEKIFESDVGGTYNVIIPISAYYDIILVGAGGGSAYCIDDFGYNGGKNGGSGAVVSGTVFLSSGSYTVVVSTAGTGNTKREQTLSAGDATSSSINGIIAGGGGGAKNVFHNAYNDRGTAGVGGKYTIPSKYSGGLTGTNGTQGKTSSSYGSYGGGGNLSGGSGHNGQNGYVLIQYNQQ